MQRRLGGLRDFPGECRSKVQDWVLMMGHLRGAGFTCPGSRVVELGTGWYPTFPFCFYLSGVARVFSYDQNRHLRPDLSVACAELLAQDLETIATIAGRPLEDVKRSQERLAASLGWSEGLEGATGGTVQYLAPADAARTDLPAGSVDLVFSNSVLEHVQTEAVAPLLREAARILKRGGLMFHSVNCGDHYAYVDPSISQLHYLRYSERSWRKWNNRFLHQNRLRAADFIRSAEECSFRIEVNTARATETRLAELARVPVDPSFREAYTREELCITSVDFVARKG
jgi:SAM-dependent methyltransferase